MLCGAPRGLKDGTTGQVEKYYRGHFGLLTRETKPTRGVQLWHHCNTTFGGSWWLSVPFSSESESDAVPHRFWSSMMTAMPEVLRVLSFVWSCMALLVMNCFCPCQSACGIFQGFTTSVSCHHMPGHPRPLMSMPFCHPPPCGKLSVHAHGMADEQYQCQRQGNAMAWHASASP
ncbi:hypothetical protein FOCG_01011 [Fusarium oxysporum f. sp. radicis-lycopersici 26381]|uniref:Uncharacterized protein n=1 Tax=Fusarium oxysporum Fo47 TaxID=660027 RepID=W9KV10_FUSOX|nr:hypothetical protein FOZG_05511 [Fusarium oxysporum Fo47]EWZ98152.1 hypothetical protein FOWG_02371 [Fusarium oxysporum f. sp. lycopersici MN25]EXL62295.1 hypothetical protein FOCG_01011 [Fusarium oxysporum f. sp. radicis-lycopersici 26381]